MLTFAEVSLSFIENLNPSQKADYGDDREADMNGKPEFLDAASHGVLWGALTAQGVALRTAINNAAGGNQAQQDALLPAVKAWDKVAKKFAKYVTEKAQEQITLASQIAVINVSGFSYNKVERASRDAAGQVTGFQMKPLTGVQSKVGVKSNALGPDCTYISVFHKDSNALDGITWNGDQIVLPVSTEPFILHTTTDSREKEVTLTSSVKWYGTRFALNKTGRGPTSEKSSATPQ